MEIPMNLAMDFLGAKKLSDTDLTAALHKAIASERSNIAASIACLIEITARDLHTRLGASSLFVYLTRDLKLSESSASKRCAALRCGQGDPPISRDVGSHSVWSAAPFKYFDDLATPDPRKFWEADRLGTKRNTAWT